MNGFHGASFWLWVNASLQSARWYRFTGNINETTGTGAGQEKTAEGSIIGQGEGRWNAGHQEEGEKEWQP
jgi:hypothetical protein